MEGQTIPDRQQTGRNESDWHLAHQREDRQERGAGTVLQVRLDGYGYGGTGKGMVVQVRWDGNGFTQ